MLISPMSLTTIASPTRITTPSPTPTSTKTSVAAGAAGRALAPLTASATAANTATTVAARSTLICSHSPKPAQSLADHDRRLNLRSADRKKPVMGIKPQFGEESEFDTPFTRPPAGARSRAASFGLAICRRRLWASFLRRPSIGTARASVPPRRHGVLGVGGLGGFACGPETALALA